MRIVNPYMRRRRRPDRWAVSSKSFLDELHRFELRQDRVMTGKIKDMTGREAKQANLVLQQAYYRSGLNKDDKLERWILKERNILNKT